MTQGDEKPIERTCSYHSNKYSLKQFAEKNLREGCWPSTYGIIKTLRHASPGNGFGDAFLKIGRSVLVDEDKFHEAVERLQDNVGLVTNFLVKV